MAADPVIIDGGGSTRIRYLPQNGVDDMDSLLNVGPLPPGFAPPGMHGSQHTFTAKLFTALKIVFIDPGTGTPTAIPVVGSFALAPGDKIEIVSGGYRVRVDINSPDGSGNSVLTSFGPPSAPPEVAPKTEQGRRRYLIDAAPPIDSVTVTLRGVTSTPFRAATMSSSYTQVHLSTP